MHAMTRAVLALLLLAASLVLGEAQAAEPAGCPTNAGGADSPKPSIGEAYDECLRCVSGHVDHLNSLITGTGPRHSSPRCTDLGPSGGAYGVFQGKFSRASDGGTSNWGTYPYPVAQACIAPETWDSNEKKCVDKRLQCQARNDSLYGPDGPVPVPRDWTSKCIDGCSLSLTNPTTTLVNGVGTIYRGVLNYSGDTCGTNPEPSQEPTPERVDAQDLKRQQCTPSGDGQSFCLKPDGKHCYTASTGRQICWTPGETGTKTDGPTMQKRIPGTESPTAPTPPEGETLQPPKTPVQTNTDGVSTTTQTWTTTNGTDGGGEHDGEPADGSGTGDGEGEGNTVGGTGDCEGAGYAPTGDPVLGAALQESWKQRCNGEKDSKGNADNATTLGDAADGMEPGAGDGVISAGPLGTGVTDTWFSYGGTTCPTFPAVTIPGTELTWEAPPQFCEAIQAFGLLFQLIAGVWALRIVGS